MGSGASPALAPVSLDVHALQTLAREGSKKAICSVFPYLPVCSQLPVAATPFERLRPWEHTFGEGHGEAPGISIPRIWHIRKGYSQGGLCHTKQTVAGVLPSRPIQLGSL
jgi:hypothetical protein